MPDRTVDVLLIGGGVASAAAARELVDGGFGGSVLLAGRELDPPYDRPSLTKEYLRGEHDRDVAHHPEAGWFDTAPVELLTRTSVMKLDTQAREATLSTKETVGYEHALVATGAMVRRLQVDGTQLDGIHYVRAYGNADAIRGELDEAARVVCVGGSDSGWAGAASLTKPGKQVTIVMLEDEPMERTSGRQVGAYVRGVLSEHGVAIVHGDEVERFAGEERVEHVVTKGGREIPAGLVVCGVGVTPDVMLARSAGLELGETGGVRCDEGLRASAPRVWAAGDVCEYASVVHGGRRIRVEHTEHAKEQGAHVARAIMGAEEPFGAVPYFYSDLADWLALESVGPAYAWDEEVVTGTMEDGTFGVWYLEDGHVRGALSAGGGLDLDRARALIVSGARVGAAGLPGA
ncbi:MAG TPA: FAD-dependent oxidoreductase [Solirubrobacteraceae bacterium]|nr:FAD-dependent oxidoreductase [Solirubrobacteraceae bacterium]